MRYADILAIEFYIFDIENPLVKSMLRYMIFKKISIAIFDKDRGT